MQRTLRSSQKLQKCTYGSTFRGLVGKKRILTRSFSMMNNLGLKNGHFKKINSLVNKTGFRTFSAQAKEPEVELFPEVCYYKTLNISTNATFDQIKSAYLKLAKKLHPDVSKDPKAKEKFPLLSEAYKVLGKPEHRKMYDETIGISDPTWSEDAKFNPEFQNNEEFMKYVRGDRNYEDEKLNMDLSYEEKNSEELYDYFRAKHLGGYGMRLDKDETSEHFGGKKFTGYTSPLRGMNGLDMQGEGLVDADNKYAFSMKIDKQYREEKRRRVEDNDYILFSQNSHDVYYATREEHEEYKNVGTSFFKESKFFFLMLAGAVGFIYTQIHPSGTGKLSGKKDSVKQKQKNIDSGIGLKNKVVPV